MDWGESSCWREPEGENDRWTGENPRVGENLREKVPDGLGRICVLERALENGATTISVLVLLRILRTLSKKLRNLGTPHMWPSSAPDAVLLVDLSLLFVLLFP